MAAALPSEQEAHFEVARCAHGCRSRDPRGLRDPHRGRQGLHGGPGRRRRWARRRDGGGRHWRRWRREHGRVRRCAERRRSRWRMPDRTHLRGRLSGRAFVRWLCRRHALLLGHAGLCEQLHRVRRRRDGVLVVWWGERRGQLRADRHGLLFWCRIHALHVHRRGRVDVPGRKPGLPRRQVSVLWGARNRRLSLQGVLRVRRVHGDLPQLIAQSRE